MASSPLSMREVIPRPRNLIETLSAEVDRLKAENLSLRDEVNRLKGEQGRPKVPQRRHPRRHPRHVAASRPPLLARLFMRFSALSLVRRSDADDVEATFHVPVVE